MQQPFCKCRTVFLLVVGFLLSCKVQVALAQDVIQALGTVIDADTKEPLLGVVVKSSDGSAGVTTDLDGNFKIKVTRGAMLVFSYIGYENKTMKASEKMAVQLASSATNLDDVVVVGYGTQKKVNLSGAVSQINGDEIASKPASDALSAMQGQMPGVAVLRGGGEPGAETSGLRIRGFSSANSTSTLVLIDGVEGDLALVNPNDIESVSVLKDASACAIYGARAASGVVLVTTKNGSSGKVKVSYNGYLAVNTPGNMPERLPAWEEQEFLNISRINDSGKIEWSPEQSSWVANPNFNYRPNNNGRWDLFQATNWVAEGTKKHTSQQNHSLSVSGGTDKLNYLVSANFFTKNGLLKYGPDKNDRYNLRMKLNSKVNDHISFNVQASYVQQITKQTPYGSKNILNTLYRVRGRQPIFQPEEDINENPYNGDLQINAIDIMKNGGVTENIYTAYMGKGELNIKDYFVKGLALKLSASRQASYWKQNRNMRNLVWYNRLGNSIRNQYGNPNELTKTRNDDYHDNAEAVLTYNTKLGKHSISALLGTSYERYRKDEISGTVKNLNSNDFFSFNYYDNSVLTNTKVSDKIETWAMMSYFGRVNYNYDDRYLFEANFRRDGSSRLAPSNRWETFPSVSGAWRVSEEKWFNVPVISNLKLRASWGQLGNGAILGLYDYIALINSNNNGGEANYYQSDMASTSKTWEIISTTNIGIDLGLFNNSLRITADYYWKKNDNMLANLELPHIVGISVPKSNVGELKTWGWEIDVNYSNKFKDLKYSIGFNLSDSQNEVVRYDGSSSIWAGTVGILEGYPLNSIWGYKTDGYWSSREEYLAYKEAHPGYQSFQDARVSGGDIKYVAQGNPDHTIGAGGGTPDDPGDLVYLGDTNARYFYGITLNLEWRGFDFSCMFQGVGKRNVVINAGDLAPLAQTYNMPWTIHRDYWTEDNPNAYWPRIISGQSYNYNPSDRWVQDASYIRLKNLQLGYTIPLKTKGIDRLRVYVSGQDIWEHSNMLKVFDPEVGNTPSSSNTYPFFRTWAFGVNLSF